MPRPDAPRRLVGSAAIALAGYLLLTLALTYPLITRFTVAIPGDGFDGWQNYWNLWWTRIALLVEHQLPFFTDLLYYPTGVGLLFHTLNPFNGFFSLPVQVAWGLFPAYNFIVLFSFAIAGLGAYLLAGECLGPRFGRWPGFVAGIIYTFSPFHIAHLLGHMQVISLEWIPFYALYLLRAVGVGRNESDGPAMRGRRVRAVVLAAFFLALTALCDWYFALYCLLLTAVILVCALWRAARTAPRAVDRLAAGGRFANPAGTVVLAVAGIWLLWGVLLSPLLLPMVREARAYRFMVPPPAESRTLSADLLAFVTPQEFHPIWGAWARELGSRFSSTVSEHQVFAGWTALLLAAAGLVVARGTRPGRGIAGAGPWPLTLLVFFVLSLGPVLHVGGQTHLLPGGGEIPLPYQWLVRVVPFMEITRSVSRLDAMVMLVIAVLAARGVQWLAGLGKRARWLACLAAVLLLFEYLPVPYPVSLPDTPAWYERLGTDGRAGAVLNLPMNWDRPGYLLYQTVHGKPLAVAYISRDDPRTLTDRVPVLQHFRHLGPDIIDFDLTTQGQQVLHDLGIRWVVLDRYKMPGGPEREYTDAAALAIFGVQPPVYQDDRLTVYEVSSAVTQAPYLILGTGWEPFDAAEHARAFQGEGPVIVQATAAERAELTVSLAPGSPPPDLPEASGVYRIALELQPGANTVILRSLVAGQRVVISHLKLVREQ